MEAVDAADALVLDDGEVVSLEEKALLAQLIFGRSTSDSLPTAAGTSASGSWLNAAAAALPASGLASARATQDAGSPFPDVHELFRFYNLVYFEGSLDFCRWAPGHAGIAGALEPDPVV